MKTDGTIIKAKTLDEKKEAMRLVMQQEDSANRIKAVAATLNDVFNSFTKVLINLRPGGLIQDVHNSQIYTYVATVQTFPHDIVTELIFEEAKSPLEEMAEKTYIILRKGVKLEEGELFIMNSKDFVKYFAIKRFTVKDLNRGGEDNLADKIDLSKKK